MKNREEFFETYGRDPITAAETEIIPEPDLSDKIEGLYIGDDVRSPETLYEIEEKRKLLEKEAEEEEQAKKQAEEHMILVKNALQIHRNEINKHVPKGGKTRVFRKKSAKKVSRRNRRSRNIRRNRRSRAHKRK